MARRAETGGTGGAPFVKFVALGDTLVAAFGGGKSRQQKDFKKDELKWKDDRKTKPLLEEVMHLVAMPGTTARAGTAEAPTDIEDGTHVRFAVSGYKWGQVIDQRKALPARAGFGVGESCSGDVYTVTLAGWSAETDNAAAATAAGFTVADGRIVLRSDEDHERWVLARVKAGQNTNAAKDFDITVRRPTDAEKRWEQAADELFDSKPWERKADAAAPDDDEPEPF